MKNNTVKVTLEYDFPKEKIIDLFISACEGGSNYWCQSLEPFTDHIDAYEAMLDGFSLKDNETGKTHKVYTADIEKAIHLMPLKAKHYFIDVINDNDDAETGDVFLQLCVFKDIIYG